MFQRVVLVVFILSFIVLNVLGADEIKQNERDLFKKYGWTVTSVTKKTVKLPKSFVHKPGDYPDSIYWAFNNELCMKMDYDLNKYRGKTVVVKLFDLAEKLPQELLPYTEATGMLVIYKNKIIGAWISGMNSGCSLDRQYYSYKKILDLSWPEWLVKRKIIKLRDKRDQQLKGLKPTEVVMSFFKELNNKDYNKAYSYLTRRYLLNMLFFKLESQEDFEPGFKRIFLGRLENLEKVQVLDIQKFIAKERYIRAYGVSTEEVHKNLGKVNKIWIVFLKREIPPLGWRIADIRQAS